MNGTIGFPDANLLRGDDRHMPYFIVADDALALIICLMKPFSDWNLKDQQYIFNYRLSRARQVVENAFGILASRFRCLLTTMAHELHNVTSVVLDCVNLHNIIKTHYQADHQGLADEKDNNHGQVPGAWRQGQVLPDLGQLQRCNQATIAAKRHREYLMHYYNNAFGAVPWQNDVI